MPRTSSLLADDSAVACRWMVVFPRALGIRSSSAPALAVSGSSALVPVNALMLKCTSLEGVYAHSPSIVRTTAEKVVGT